MTEKWNCRWNQEEGS